MAGIELAPATEADTAELLVLQRCCWVSEALVNERLDIPALHDTHDEVRAWVTSWHAWCARKAGRLIGAVRGRSEDATTWDIGRLMVAPDMAGQGTGRWLLRHVEQQAPHGTTTYTLFTGARSARNLDLYRRAGYTISALPPGMSQPEGTVYLTKAAPPDR